MNGGRVVSPEATLAELDEEMLIEQVRRVAAEEAARTLDEARLRAAAIRRAAELVARRRDDGGHGGRAFDDR